MGRGRRVGGVVRIRTRQRVAGAYAEPGAHLGVATVGVVVWVVANAVWFQVHRGARLWDHEEMTYAQNVAHFAAQEGDYPWSGLFVAHYGPMQAMLGAPSQWLFGINEATVVWVNIGLTAITGLVVYWIVCRLADGAAGLVAGALVLLTPGMLENARGALTMVPATTFLTIALAAVVAGSGLRRWQWSVVAGVALGCMSLSRPMAIAFVPGLVVPAVVWSQRTGTPFGVMVRNGVVLGAAAVASSVWWWGLSYADVLDYLSVGAQGVATGDVFEVLDNRLYELEAYIGPIAFPSFLGYTVYTAGLAFAVLYLVDRRRARPPAIVRTPGDDAQADQTEGDRRKTGSLDEEAPQGPRTLPLWPVWAGVLLNLVVSLLSNTIGWLMLPLVPWIVVAAVAGVRRVLARGTWMVWVGIVLVPVAVLAVATSTLAVTPGNRFTWCMEPWQTTSACVIDDRAEAAAWKSDIRQITADALSIQDELVAQGREHYLIGVAARDHIVLPAAFRLQSWVDAGRGLDARTFVEGDTLSLGAYEEFVQEAGVVVVSPDVEPYVLYREMVDPDTLVTRLAGEGFAPCRAVELPDGRVVQIMVREPLPVGTCD